MDIARIEDELPIPDVISSVENRLVTAAEKLPGELSLAVGEALLDLSDCYKQDGKLEQEENCIERAYDIVRRYVKQHPELLSSAQKPHGQHRVNHRHSVPMPRIEF